MLLGFYLKGEVMNNLTLSKVTCFLLPYLFLGFIFITTIYIGVKFGYPEIVDWQAFILVLYYIIFRFITK